MNITTKVVRTGVKRVRLTLDMDRRETIAFLAILERIGGVPGGPRGMFSKISEELKNNLGDTNLSVRGDYGSIEFPVTWEDLEANLEEKQ